MAKDPAFLFYPGDWLGGTMAFTFEEKGAYMELLLLQFNQGTFTEAQAKHMLSTCNTSVWHNIKHKFSKNGVGYFNDRLKIEMEKRKRFSESRRNNALGKNSNEASAVHMEDRNENENRNIKSYRHLFSESKYFDNLELFKEDFYATKTYEKFDAEYYYKAVKNWSASKGSECNDWIAKSYQFVDKDGKDGKAELKKVHKIYLPKD